uniref:Methyl-accepting chemotaxis protein n=1 Tax=candidate division WOR-3 bacterium TaxID=2052148 RepID=A0A7C4U6T2_UNCW3
MNKKLLNKYIWGTNLISILVSFILIIFLLPFYVKIERIKEIIYFSFLTGSIVIILLIIYHIFQGMRLKKVLKNSDVKRIYLTPFYSSLHKLIDYCFAAPLLFLIVNSYLNVLPLNKVIDGTIVVLFIGLVVSMIVYYYGEIIINEELKKYKEEIKGFSLFSKFFVTMLISILFSFFIGIVFTRFKLGIIYLVLPLSLSLVFIIRLKKNIDELMDSFSSLTSGNISLSKRLNLKSGDEIDILGYQFNKFLDIISEFIKDIKTASEKMKKVSEIVASSNEEITASIEQISSSLDNFNNEISQSLNDIKELKQSAEAVNAMAEDMESQTMMLKKIAEDSEKIAIDGISSIEEVLKTIEENIKSVGEINKRMVSLISASDEIMGFANMINDVADDTDLLALNASIEAARVGEMGKGFSVIAEEIRNLSNLSRDYLSKVNDTLEKVKFSINEFKSLTENTWNEVSKNLSSLDSIRDALNKISQNIALTTNMTGQVSETIKEEVLNVSSVFVKIENISKSFSNFSAAIEEISASTEEQMASLEEISSISQDLLNNSKELEKLISKYLS